MNRGDDLGWASLSFEVSAHEGTIDQIGDLESGSWMNTGHYEFRETWRLGEAKRVIVAVEGRALPGPGTYLVRLVVREWKPAGPPEQIVREELELAEVPADAIAKLEKQMPAMAAEAEVDLGALTEGQFRSRDVFIGTVVDYVRIEPFSSVLSFGLFLGTFVTALATIVLAVQG